MRDHTKVIGVGNSDRGDDGVGPAVASRVAERTLGIDISVSAADPSRLLDEWAGAGRVVIIDAVVDGSEPGTVSVIDAGAGEIPPDAGSVSSHGMGVAAAVDLGRALERLPEELVVVGVSARSFDGTGLTEEVAAAIPGAVDAVLEVMSRA